MEVSFKGSPTHTIGNLPSLGHKAPDFTLVKTDLSNLQLNALTTHHIILNIFISLDTSVCANSVRTFNEKISDRNDITLLCISMDLPFAHQRFCNTENIKNIIMLSAFRNPEFGKDYGLTIINGPLKGLLSRAVIVLDSTRKVIYTEQVPEMTREPDYEAVLKLKIT